MAYNAQLKKWVRVGRYREVIELAISRENWRMLHRSGSGSWLLNEMMMISLEYCFPRLLIYDSHRLELIFGV